MIDGQESRPVIGAAYVCRKDDLLDIADDAVARSWAARLGDRERGQVDPKSGHLVVPFLTNGSSPEVPPSYRCYLWYKIANENRRSCVVIDVADSRLAGLDRPTIYQYDRFLFMLVEQLPIDYLDPFD
jgi:hypothetical protein